MSSRCWNAIGDAWTPSTIDEPLPEILDRVSKLPPDTIVLYLSMLRDAENRIRVLPEVAKELAQASSAPVYGFFETYFGVGIIGGSIASFRKRVFRRAGSRCRF